MSSRLFLLIFQNVVIKTPFPFTEIKIVSISTFDIWDEASTDGIILIKREPSHAKKKSVMSRKTDDDSSLLGLSEKRRGAARWKAFSLNTQFSKLNL